MLAPGLLGVPWLVWSGVCLAVAAIYTVVWPRSIHATSLPWWRHFLLRWSHAAVWLALTLSCLIRAVGKPGELADVLALAALVLYVAFIATVAVERARSRR